MAEKVKLNGGPEKTVTWIWLEADILKAEFYDFSEVAERMFGNDIAYVLTVEDMDKLFSVTEQNQSSLMQWITKNFSSYFDLEKRLEENGIRFHREVDSRT